MKPQWFNPASAIILVAGVLAMTTFVAPLDSGAPVEPGRSAYRVARGLVAQDETVSFAVLEDRVAAPGLFLGWVHEFDAA